MRILKASAGSGKTYRLSHQYIDILLGSPDRYAYRHILAVTFTNKATAGMKSRILKDLNELSAKDPRAREILIDILHDYSAFSVCTIDKFFQQALKAFSREIGQMADYQIELDRNSLVQEAMDRILDSLTDEPTDLLRWIKASVSDRMETGQRYDVEESLYEIGRQLKSEEHRRLAEDIGVRDAEQYSKDKLETLRKECRKIIRDFENRASALGLKAAPGIMMEVPKSKTMKSLPPEAAELFGEPYDLYCTAYIIDRKIFSLGLAGEFYREFDALLKEKNIMCLDESNTLLRRIIDGSDAPFVYEKLGVRYENFLLDEFQDTSNIQWENFLPLLRESDSKGGENLIVGDVKQSIYRWRDSDWNLLGTEVQKEFPEAVTESLKCNWRSAKRIVDFNSAFFSHISRSLGLEKIYEDVVQEAMKVEEGQEGSVQVTFCDDQMAAVVDSISRAVEAGARFGDIAVLVRDNKHGSLVASELIQKGIPVVSDESLKLKSSVVVRRVVSLLSCMENPGDKVNSFLSESMGGELPEQYHSLVDLSESILRIVRDHDPESFSGDTLFIQAFMDDLQSWCSVYGNNLRQYLKHWEESDIAIGCPDDSDAVRVITVHKAKGLEFPYVIFPFAEKVVFYKKGVRWCNLSAGTALDGMYPVELGKASGRTLFRQNLEEERRMQIVDNINVFYVALTRAEKGMHIIAATPTKVFKTSLEKNAPDPKNFADLLYDYCGRFEDRMFGTMYDFAFMERPESDTVEHFPAFYPSIPLAGRLEASEDASDFFADDGAVGVEASQRLRGKVLHDILSRVDSPDDLRRSVDSAVKNGMLSSEEGDKYYEFLRGRLLSHSDWFCGGGRNEMTLFNVDGEEKRPDRVLITPDEVTVIDYKFAQRNPSYVRQVRGYMNIFRSMGHSRVRGYLWFVQENEVEEII